VKLKVLGQKLADRYAPLPPWALSAHLAATSRARGRVFDLDVLWGRGRAAIELRPVGVSEGATKRIRWYLTTVPREVLSASEVIQAYRLRWLIELLFRELRQSADIGRSHTADPNALQALTYGASLEKRSALIAASGDRRRVERRLVHGGEVEQPRSAGLLEPCIESPESRRLHGAPRVGTVID
jgi:hypothetical protein